MRRRRGDPGGRSTGPGRLDVGRRIRDTRNEQEGVVLDYACQYPHPKADPVYSYLIKWEDGQIQAISETALRGGPLELID